MISEDNPLDSSIGMMLYEFIASIEDDLRNGSIALQRRDTFKKHFEAFFETPISNIESIEELIANDEEQINYYITIRNGIARAFDTYFGISFNNIDDVTLSDLYLIYQIIYAEFVQFLCMYAVGKVILEKNTLDNALHNAYITKEESNQDIVDSLLGTYILDEDEFTDDNIALALEAGDPGNELYMKLFGEASALDPGDPSSYQFATIRNVSIYNIAFRLKVKSEYLKEGMKELIENRLITIMEQLKQ